MIRLQFLTQPGGLDWGQAMMRVVQQMDFLPILCAQGFEQFWDLHQVFLCGPHILRGQTFCRRFVEHLVVGHAVGRGQSGHTGLCAHREISLLDIFLDFVAGFFDISAVGVAVNHDASAALSPQ